MAKTLGVTFAIGAQVSPTVASAFATVEEKIRASQAKMREMSEKSRVLAAADAARQRVAETQKAYAATGGQDAGLREKLAQEVAAFNKAYAAAQKYGVAVADLPRAHAQADKALAATTSRLEALQKAQQFKAKRQEAADSLKAAAVPALMVAAPIRDAIKFESAMASAAKTIDGMRDENGALTAQYYQMEAAIRQMGQTLPLTHDELARLFAAGGQQGMTGIDELREFTAMAAQMAVAFDMSNEDAADSIGGFRSALNLTMPEARSLLDLMNHYANTTSASEKGIADVVRRVGSLGSVGGVAAKPVAALAATLDAMKVAPEVAATGIKNLILAMTAGSAATRGQKAAFAELGIDTVKLAKQMQVDGPAAIVSVLEVIQKLPKAQQLSTMQQIFGKESLGSIAPLLANLDKVRENLITCGNESKYAGAMQQEFDNVSGTTANRLILLKNRLQEVGITVAGALLPAIQSITEAIGPPISAIARFAGEHKSLATAIAGGAALVGLKAGMAATAWAVSGIGGAFNLAKAAITGLSLASKAAAGVQVAFNAVMAANPVGLVVTGVAALGAGLVSLYKTCEPVRAVFDAVFTFIGDKVSWLAEKFGALVNGFSAVAGGVKAAFSGALKFFGLGGDEEEKAAPTPAAEPMKTAQAEASAASASAVPNAAAIPAPSRQMEMMPAAEPAKAAQSQAPAESARAQPEAVAQNPKAAPNQASAASAPQADLKAEMPKTENSGQNQATLPTEAAAATRAPEAAVSQAAPAPQSEAAAANMETAQASAAAARPESPQRDSGKEAANIHADSAPAAVPDFEALLGKLAQTGAAANTQTSSAPAQTQAVQPQVQVALNITQNGIPDAQFASGVMNAIKSRQGELERMISAIVNEQARLAYG